MRHYECNFNKKEYFFHEGKYYYLKKTDTCDDKEVYFIIEELKKEKGFSTTDFYSEHYIGSVRYKYFISRKRTIDKAIKVIKKDKAKKEKRAKIENKAL